jgi:hypothetical protein
MWGAYVGGEDAAVTPYFTGCRLKRRSTPTLPRHPAGRCFSGSRSRPDPRLYADPATNLYGAAGRLTAPGLSAARRRRAARAQASQGPLLGYMRWALASVVAGLSKVAGNLDPRTQGGVGHRLAAHEPHRHDAGPHVEGVVGVAVHRWSGTHLRRGLVKR